MYADPHSHNSRFSPTGLTAAIAVNALFVAALIFSVPTIVTGPTIDEPLETYTVHNDPPPPPPEPVLTRRPAGETILSPVPVVPVPFDPGVAVETSLDSRPTGPIIGEDPGPVVVDLPEPPPPLALVEPALDQRYARDFQPVYPAAERRAGREGRVTVSVLVGVDGRVKEAKRLAATSDDFWRVTLDRALAKWRFKPGTRGGVPVEAWRTLSLTFVLKD